MKKFYFEPAIEIKRFWVEDVITASGGEEDNQTSIKGTKDNSVNGVKIKSLSWDNFTF